MNDKDQLLLLRYAVTCMGRSAAACVADLHSNGLLHRDIKPENLLQLVRSASIQSIEAHHLFNLYLKFVGRPAATHFIITCPLNSVAWPKQLGA